MRKTIQYAIDSDTGLVWSRIGSYVAVPILDYPRDRYFLEKCSITSITGRVWDGLRWTRKIDIWTKNLHRKFWGMKELA